MKSAVFPEKFKVVEGEKIIQQGKQVSVRRARIKGSRRDSPKKSLIQGKDPEYILCISNMQFLSILIFKFIPYNNCF